MPSTQTINELDAVIGTRVDNSRLPLTRFPTVVSVALYQATAEIDVVRVNDGPPWTDRFHEMRSRRTAAAQPPGDVPGLTTNKMNSVNTSPST